jgi:cysteine desulfurase/selenocysteine lyase
MSVSRDIVATWRRPRDPRDFPILSREVNGKPLVYLDNGASAQKPQVVIDAVTRAYAMEYANVHAACTTCRTSRPRNTRRCAAPSRASSARMRRDRLHLRHDRGDQPRGLWLGHAADAGGRRDRAVVMEHHANIVPWHFLRERQGVVLKWVDVDANGDLDPQAVIDAIGPKTKLVAITHMSNVLGTKVDVKAIVDAAHAGRAGAGRRQPGGGAHARRRGARLRFLRDHRPQALWPLGSGAIYIRANGWTRCAPSSAAAT